MEGLDQVVDFLGHDRENPRGPLADRGECVRRAGRYDDMVALVEDPPAITDQHFQLPTEHAECLIGPVVHVRRSLVARVRLQIPSLDHKVRHANQLSNAANRLTVPDTIGCSRQGIARDAP